jgi:hypothetical protein
MATVKISELTPLNSASVTADDLLHIINIEETTGNYPTGTNKRITAQNLANGLAGLATVIPQTIQTALDNKVSLENFNNASLKIAAPVAAATTTNINLASTLNTVLIDGVQLLVNDRVLVKNQNDNKFNGIYVVNSGVPTRATDFDTLTEINNGYVLVNGGDTQKGSAWAVTSTVAVVNTDPIVFTQFAAAVTNINKASIGLGQVNNTSDLNKPLSTATTAALALKQGTITGAASTITTNDLAIDRALISNGTGKVAVSAITSTELGRLNGVSSNIQNQLNAKAPINNPTFTGTVNLPSGTKIDGTSVDLIPAGAIMAFAMNSAPSGWLACNGSTINRVTYARLFAAISTLYGAGNGTSTFRLPDLRGYFVRGYGEDDGSGAFGAKQADALQNIIGKINLNSNAGLAATFSGAFYSEEGPTSNQVRFGEGGVPGDYTFDASRVARTSNETRPKNIAMLYCIKI